MIRSFVGKDAERLFHREPVRRLPPTLLRVALRKLVQLDAATRLDDLRVPPGNRLEALRGTRRASTAYESTISGGSAFAGTTATRSTSRSWTTTRRLS